MFEIRFEEEKCLLTLTLRGYWDMKTYKSYEVEASLAIRKLRLRHDHLKILVDTSEFEVQSAEVSEAFQRDFASLANSKTMPIAMVAASMLNKTQARRIFPYPNVHLFWTVEDARQWLHDGAAPSS